MKSNKYQSGSVTYFMVYIILVISGIFLIVYPSTHFESEKDTEIKAVLITKSAEQDNIKKTVFHAVYRYNNIDIKTEIDATQALNQLVGQSYSITVPFYKTVTDSKVQAQHNKINIIEGIGWVIIFILVVLPVILIGAAG